MKNLYFNVSSDWETKRIKDLLPKFLNGVWGEYANDENGTPVLRSTEQNVEGVLNILEPAILEIKKVGKNNKLKNKDLLLTKSSGSKQHIGKCSYITSINGEGYCFSNFMMGIRFGNLINSKFLKYCINNILVKKQINNNSLNITLNNLTNESVGQLLIPFPNLELQNNIANYLDIETSKIDRKISILEQKFDKLEEYKQSVIFEIITKGLDSNVSMKESGIDWIGDIPSHWEIKRVKDMAPNYLNGVWGDYSDDTNGVAVLRSTEQDINGNLNILNPAILNISNIKYKNKLITNDLLLTKSSGSKEHVGKCSYITKNNGEGYCFSNFMMGIRFSDKKINTKFLYYCINNIFIKSQINNNSVSITLNNLTNFSVGNLYIVCPPNAEQQEISLYLDSFTLKIDKKKEIIKKQIQLLREYKQSIIFESVTGKKEII